MLLVLYSTLLGGLLETEELKDTTIPKCKNVVARKESACNLVRSMSAIMIGIWPDEFGLHDLSSTSSTQLAT
jgi:hypothetical protein